MPICPTHSRPLLALATATALLVGLTACGNSDTISRAGDTTVTAAPDTADTASPGDSSGPLGTLGSIPGVSADCLRLYNEFTQAMSSMMTGQSTDAAAMFDALQKVLPEELHAAAATMSEAYSKFAAVLAKYENDPTKAASDPDFLAAIQAMGSEKITNATQAISDYFDRTCPTK